MRSALLALATLIPLSCPGGTFVYSLKKHPHILHPLHSLDVYAHHIHRYIFESLLERDIETNQWHPQLARAWEISPDGQHYTFTLRKRPQWHDGRPLTAEDVKFSFEAIVDPQNHHLAAHQRPAFEHIIRAEIGPSGTIRFKAQARSFLSFEAVARMKIIPKHIYENSQEKKALVGTGPYTFESYKRGKFVSLKANPSWWGRHEALTQDRHLFEKVLIRFIEDPTTALAKLERGEIDFLALSAEDYVKRARGEKWGKEIFKFQVQNKYPKGWDYVGLNLKNPLFTSKKVRLALAHLVNRKLIVEKIFHGWALMATGPFHRLSDYADPAVRPLEFDPPRAARLLKEDGWAIGPGKTLFKTINKRPRALSFTILTSMEAPMKYLTLFKEEARKLGIEAHLKRIDWSALLRLLNERKFEAVALKWPGEAQWNPRKIWHTSSIEGQGSNFVSYSNPAVDRLIEQAEATFGPKKRAQILRKVYRAVAEDVPYIFLFNHPYTFYAHSKRIQKKRETYPYSIGRNRWWVDKLPLLPKESQ